MKQSYVFGLLLASVFVVPAYAQGLKINPFPTAQQPSQEQVPAPEPNAAATSTATDFTQEALKQLGEERVFDNAPAPRPQSPVQSAKSDGGSIFRVDPVPMLEPVTPAMPPPSMPSAPNAADSGRYEQAISDFDSPVLPEPIQAQQQPVQYITNVPSSSPSREQAAARQSEAFQGVLERSVYEEEYMREVQQQIAAANNKAQVERPLAAPVQEPAALRQVPIVVLEEKTQYQDLEPAAYSSPGKGWNVSANQSVRDALERWSAAEGVSLIWDSQVDFEVSQGFSDAGTYEDAVAKLLDQHMSEGLRPVGKLYADPVTGVRVLTIKAARS